MNNEKLKNKDKATPKCNCSKKRKRHMEYCSTLDHNIFDCPLIKLGKENNLQYLYIDPIFMKQTLKNDKELDDEFGDSGKERFFDCYGSEEDSHIQLQNSYNMAEVINHIKDPREFKCLMREVAQTSHILYRCFRRAYHKAKKLNKSRMRGKTSVEKCKENIEKIGERETKHAKKEKNFRELNDMAKKLDCDCNRHISTTASPIDFKQKFCDCLEKCNQMKKGTIESISNFLETQKGSVDFFEIPNLCVNHDKEYEGLEFCERCAKLRGELIMTNNSQNSNGQISRNALHEDESTKELEGGQEGGSIQEVKATSNEPLEKTPTNIDRDSSNLKTPIISPIPYANNQNNLPCSCHMRQSSKAASPAPHLCTCKAQPIASVVDVSPPIQPTTIISSPDKCCQHCQSPHSCSLCHSLSLVPSASIKHHSNADKSISTKSHREKSLRKLKKSIQMEPISFILPINLQIQNSTGETRFVQTHIAMEASAVLDDRKRKSSKNKEKTTIAVTTTSQSQTHNANYGKALGETTPKDSSEIFYSCSSSSVTETVINSSEQPCESLVEILDIVKDHVAQNKNIPRQVLEKIISSNYKECLGKPKSISLIAEATTMTEEEPAELQRDLNITPQTLSSTKVKKKLQTKFQEPESIDIPQKPTIEQLPKPSIPKENKIQRSEAIAPAVGEKLAIPTSNEKASEIEVSSISAAKLKFSPSTNSSNRLPDDLITLRPDSESITETLFLKSEEMPTVTADLTNLQSPLTANMLQEYEHQTFHDPQKKELSSTSKNTEKPKSPISIPNRVSQEMQTDISSFQALAHYRRNEMRKDILENLRELLGPPSLFRNKNKYKLLEIEEILGYLHTIFNPNRLPTISNEESRESVLQNIRLILNPNGVNRTFSSTSMDPRLIKERRLQDIGYILYPKSNRIPTKHYSKDEREMILEILQNFLTPRNITTDQQAMETRRSLANQLILLLNGEPEAETSATNQRSPITSDIRERVLDDVKYILNDKKMSSQELNRPHRSLPEISESSSDEEPRKPQTKRPNPPVPKKPTTKKTLHQQPYNDDAAHE
ncbi:uncharacterized protein LOC142230065 isoform X2 [Haematobia irritans]